MVCDEEPVDALRVANAEVSQVKWEKDGVLIEASIPRRIREGDKIEMRVIIRNVDRHDVACFYHTGYMVEGWIEAYDPDGSMLPYTIRGQNLFARTGTTGMRVSQQLRPDQSTKWAIDLRDFIEFKKGHQEVQFRPMIRKALLGPPMEIKLHALKIEID
jgi:hypothetical protein